VLGAIAMSYPAAGQSFGISDWGRSASFDDLRDHPAHFDELKSCPQLESLSLARARVSTLDLARLTEFPQLAWIDLEGSPIDDEACEVLGCLESLEDLCLVGTWVTDRGVESLCRAPRLRSLDLRGTRVTEAALLSLATCDELRFVDLRGTQVSQEAVAPFRISVPGMRVLCDRR